ncbi:MAG: hypothetical protein ACP5NS_03680 [Candidatus Pacearchaeota archaeon]
MQVSESKLKVISISFTLMLILVTAHSYYTFFGSKAIANGNTISGSAIAEVEENEEIFGVQRVAFVVGEWVLVIGILMYLLIKSKMHNSKHDIQNEYLVTTIKKSNKVSETDLDILYKVLNEKKELQISELAKYFKVTDKIMLEWCNILEEARMILIKYPLIGSPVAKYIEKEKNAQA